MQPGYGRTPGLATETFSPPPQNRSRQPRNGRKTELRDSNPRTSQLLRAVCHEPVGSPDLAEAGPRSQETMCKQCSGSWPLVYTHQGSRPRLTSLRAGHVADAGRRPTPSWAHRGRCPGRAALNRHSTEKENEIKGKEGVKAAGTLKRFSLLIGHQKSASFRNTR